MRLPVPPETRTHPSHVTADVAVVGGGPVGCATALAFAESGARVCLIDANAPSGRLAGEWLHPTGVGVLTVGSLAGTGASAAFPSIGGTVSGGERCAPS